MCWTLCAKKNLSKSPLLISDEDAFKVWVIFNFLSEDKYPLIIVPEEVRNKNLCCSALLCLVSQLGMLMIATLEFSEKMIFFIETTFLFSKASSAFLCLAGCMCGNPAGYFRYWLLFLSATYTAWAKWECCLLPVNALFCRLWGLTGAGETNSSTCTWGCWGSHLTHG